MVWYFIGVYIINRTLHSHLEIRNFSSCVEKIFHSFAHFSTLEEKFGISVQPCNILYIFSDGEESREYKWVQMNSMSQEKVRTYLFKAFFGCKLMKLVCVFT